MFRTQSDSPDSNLLTVGDTSMRPRAYTDPTSDGKMKFSLPKITIEDCSDPVDDDDMFACCAQPRRRANTCPEEFFRRRKVRPPTPPPTSRSNSPTNKFTFPSPTKNGVSFVHHKLSNVSEDSSDASCKNSKLASAKRRRSLGTMTSLISGVDKMLTLKETEKDVNYGDTSSTHEDGTKSDTEIRSDFNDTPKTERESPEVYTSKDCRFSQTISPTLDNNPLQAC